MSSLNSLFPLYSRLPERVDLSLDSVRGFMFMDSLYMLLYINTLLYTMSCTLIISTHPIKKLPFFTAAQQPNVSQGFLDHTQWHILGRTPLDQYSPRHRPLKNKTLTRNKTSMPPAEIFLKSPQCRFTCSLHAAEKKNNVSSSMHAMSLVIWTKHYIL